MYFAVAHGSLTAVRLWRYVRCVRTASVEVGHPRGRARERGTEREQFRNASAPQQTGVGQAQGRGVAGVHRRERADTELDVAVPAALESTFTTFDDEPPTSVVPIALRVDDSQRDVDVRVGRVPARGE